MEDPTSLEPQWPEPRWLTDQELALEMASVIRRFFPRWRNARHWCVRAVPQRTLGHAIGRCSSHRREILIAMPWTRGRIRLRALLVHECCHAVLDQGHTTIWRRRMGRAATIARLWESDGLADELEFDAMRYDPLRALPRTERDDEDLFV
jgi:hypothetical protein